MNDDRVLMGPADFVKASEIVGVWTRSHESAGYVSHEATSELAGVVAHALAAERHRALAIGHGGRIWTCAVCRGEGMAGIGLWAAHADLDQTPVHRGKCWETYQRQKLGDKDREARELLRRAVGVITDAQKAIAGAGPLLDAIAVMR